MYTIIQLSYADEKQYKKGKDLLKEIGKPRRCQRRLSISIPRSPTGSEINTNDRRTPPTPPPPPPHRRLPTHSPNEKPKISLRPVSPLPRLPDSPYRSDGSERVSMMDSVQKRISSDAVTLCATMGECDQKAPEPMRVNFGQPQVNLRKVSDTIDRPGWKSTFDVGLLSTEYREELDEAELNFLNWLNAEIKKVDDFYREKERVAAERYKIISSQLEALRHLRDGDQTDKSNRLVQGMSISKPNGHHCLRSTRQTLISKLRGLIDRLSSAMPAADHYHCVERPELMAIPIATTAGYVEYHVARRRLKRGMLEFYRSMELLKEYRLLNLTALAKILKKFEKITGRKISGESAPKLMSLHLDQSDVLENLMNNSEVRATFRIT